VSLAIGLCLALLSAVAIGGAFFVEHSAASALPELSLRRPATSLRHLFTSRRWLAGYVVGWGGWGLYILALRFAPLSLVQTVAAGGVGVLALATWRWGGVRLRRSEVVGVSACLIGLGAVAVSLAVAAPSSARPEWSNTMVWIAACVGAAGVLALLPRTALAPGAGLGAAAGLLYAAADIATKGALIGVGWLLVPILLACTGLAFATLQLAFQRGGALQTAGMSALFTNVVPISAGVVLFRERVPLGAFGIMRLVGFAAVVLGAVLLARRLAPNADVAVRAQPSGAVDVKPQAGAQESRQADRD